MRTLPVSPLTKAKVMVAIGRQEYEKREFSRLIMGKIQGMKDSLSAPRSFYHLFGYAPKPKVQRLTRRQQLLAREMERLMP